MKTCRRAFLALLAWALGGLLMAHAGPDVQTVSGTVVSLGNISFVVDADDGRRITFLVDTATSLPTGGLLAGDPVVVRYRELDSVRSQAVEVTRFGPLDTTTAPRPATEPATRASDDMLPPAAGPEPLLVVAGLATLAAASLLAALRNPGRQA